MHPLRSSKAYNDGKRHHLVARNAVTDVGTPESVWHVGGDTLQGWPQVPTRSQAKGSVDETALHHVALTNTHRTLSGR